MQSVWNDDFNMTKDKAIYLDMKEILISSSKWDAL